MLLRLRMMLKLRIIQVSGRYIILISLMIVMSIKSDKDYLCGQPRIEGHRIWVSHVIAHVNESGLEYCMNERCVGSAISYCQGCTKSGEGGEDCWKVAKQVYKKVFME